MPSAVVPRTLRTSVAMSSPSAESRPSTLFDPDMILSKVSLRSFTSSVAKFGVVLSHDSCHSCLPLPLSLRSFITSLKSPVASVPTSLSSSSSSSSDVLPDRSSSTVLCPLITHRRAAHLAVYQANTLPYTLSSLPQFSWIRIIYREGAANDKNLDLKQDSASKTGREPSVRAKL